LTVYPSVVLFLFPPPPQLSVLLPGNGELNSELVLFLFLKQDLISLTSWSHSVGFLFLFMLELGIYYLKSEAFRAAKFREIYTFLGFELNPRFLDRNKIAQNITTIVKNQTRRIRSVSKRTVYR
jgi:hypothetical protein